MSYLTHFDDQGHAHMVDVGAKASTHRIAGIMASKKTSDLIPLCHPLALTRVSIEFETKVADTTGVASIN